MNSKSPAALATGLFCALNNAAPAGLLTPTMREGATFEVERNLMCNGELSDSHVASADGIFSRVARLLTDIMHVDGPGGTG